ncbi:MAG: chloride channel protein [Chloroflexi bacterium]|nr:chloride channel protein [Chloroflexota bacterium]
MHRLLEVFRPPTAKLRDLTARVEPFIPYALAVVVGLGAGAGAIVFRELISAFNSLFFGRLADGLGALGDWRVVLLPAIGGLFVGPLIYFLAREAKGHGVPEVMLAVERQGGRIRPRVAAVKSLASALTIGSGGSVGREGPIVQIASAIASTIGQWARLPDDNVRLLVAAGAAGGISATFNAPIAGVFFALEVILRHFNVRNFSVVVLSSVVAAAIAHARFGDNPAFAVPAYQLESALEFPLYALLGLMAGLAGLLFVWVLYASEDFFDRVALPEWVKPALGGVGVGLLGLWHADVFGVGYGSGPGAHAIPSALTGQRALEVLLVLAGLKILATSVTIGSGGSGGVFAPSLFIGAMLGGAFGNVVHQAWPGTTAPEGAYATVGMAAVFAGAARAPITAILILFEMTRDYSIILPLMTAVVVSTVVAQVLRRDTIYTLKLRRRGIDIGERREESLLAAVPVGRAMSHDFEVVRADLPANDLLEVFSAKGAREGALPVVDGDSRLVGIVGPSDLERALDRELSDLTVADIATKNVVVAHPDQTLDEAVRRMSAQSLRQLPVVSRGDVSILLGMLSRSNIFAVYGKVSSALPSRRLSPLAGIEAYGTEVIEVSIKRGSPVLGRSLKDIALPPEGIIVSILRRGVAIIPRGDVQLQAGDRLVIVTLPEARQKVHSAITGTV